ncbi:AmmeMemoRadiSam system protein B [Candidatus Uhrbacteria bacterium]|nr:AmmeMemoRadiSam system protein B [Candidatus Uhrbacteria bacterium]
MCSDKVRLSFVSIVFVCALAAASAVVFFSARASNADPAGVAHESLPKFPETSAIQQTRVSGIVVPHHDIVRERRATLFETIRDRFFGDTTPNAIILIAPNHFNAGSGLIQTVDREWNTSYGTIMPASAVIRSLIDAGIASSEPVSFEREHGILLVLKDIKKNFPSSPIVPLIVKDNTKGDTIKQLASSLNDSCASCLVVASVDFSHYQPAALADLHDRLSIRALQNRDIASLSSKAEVDSGHSLAFLAQWANLHDTQRFSLFDHTNSGTIVSDPDQESTSHVFGWYESGEAVVVEQSVTFAFAGDMMYGRAVGYHYEKKGFKKLFEQFGNRVFWGVDAAIANLEGPISDGKVAYDPALRSLSFNFPKQSRDALAYLRLSGVSLANNHTLNQGTKGLDTTRKLLKKKQIVPIGDPSRVVKNDVAYFEGDGLRLAVVGVHAFADMSGTESVIRSLKKDPHTRVIVFPHWGVEYELKHSQQQEQLARAWIDAGADAVIGAHPHVIQDVGVYKGKPIVYSLGNFIFDQNFSTNTQQGLIVAGEFTAKGLSLVLLPHESVRYQPRILTGKAKKTILKRITQGLEKYRVSPETAALLFFPSE